MSRATRGGSAVRIRRRSCTTCLIMLGIDLGKYQPGYKCLNDTISQPCEHYSYGDIDGAIGKPEHGYHGHDPIHKSYFDGPYEKVSFKDFFVPFPEPFQGKTQDKRVGIKEPVGFSGGPAKYRTEILFCNGGEQEDGQVQQPKAYQ